MRRRRPLAGLPKVCDTAGQLTLAWLNAYRHSPRACSGAPSLALFACGSCGAAVQLCTAAGATSPTATLAGSLAAETQQRSVGARASSASAQPRRETPRPPRRAIAASKSPMRYRRPKAPRRKAVGLGRKREGWREPPRGCALLELCSCDKSKSCFRARRVRRREQGVRGKVPSRPAKCRLLDRCRSLNNPLFTALPSWRPSTWSSPGKRAFTCEARPCEPTKTPQWPACGTWSPVQTDAAPAMEQARATLPRAWPTPCWAGAPNSRRNWQRSVPRMVWRSGRLSRSLVKCRRRRRRRSPPFRLSCAVQLPGLHASAGPSLHAFRPPTAAQAAEAALAGELPAVAGLGPPSAATQADVDAFLRGLPPGAAAPHGQFAEFESIYAAQAAQGRFVPPPPGAAALPPALAAQARDAAAPMLQVGPAAAVLLLSVHASLQGTARALPLVCRRCRRCCLPPHSLLPSCCPAALLAGLCAQQLRPRALCRAHGSPGPGAEPGGPAPHPRSRHDHGAAAVCGPRARVCGWVGGWVAADPAGRALPPRLKGQGGCRATRAGQWLPP